jgi:predicted nucleic acid-binding protein
MIILDTNVLSEMIKPRPAPEVTTWLDRQDPAELWITTITVAELLSGVARMPAGRRRESLQSVVSRLVDDVFGERILGFDRAAAVEYASVVSTRFAAGRPVGMADAQIAAVCRVHAATLATRNLPDFIGTGIELIDPWSA